MNLPENRSSSFHLAVLIEGGLAVLAVVLAWVFNVSLREQLGPNVSAAGQKILSGIAAALPLLAGFWWLVHASWPAAQRLKRQVEQLLRTLFPQATVIQLLIVAFVAGLGEELLFRGVLQALIARWTSPLIGLVVASFIFGMFHAVSLLYFVLATLAGAYFGWLTRLSGLLSAIVAHGLYDFIALIYLSRSPNIHDATYQQSSEEQGEAK